MSKSSTDSPAYLDRKREMGRMLTIYGRKPVLEALQDKQLDIRRVHLADSNRQGGIIDSIIELSTRRDIPIARHERKALSRISRNAKQDQGVAADLALPSLQWLDEIDKAKATAPNARFLLCDGISNPQNLGMIIRSVAAAGISGLIVPQQGNASISPLVIKASAGAVFRCPLYISPDIDSAVSCLHELGIALYTLSADAGLSIKKQQINGAAAFVLGNETEGPGAVAKKASSASFFIPMANGVESLNVAVTAALVAFMLR
ncbi:MAG: RNA methyltransferase [Gammaproteobacteria bacterium]|nr:RNA methyltransferase [Gammaproteobacteria bacterium]NNL10559.1 RNA methyltransferase [Pseudomonadales bacterium]NNM10387.1 RNA methyltransferase [Pseudomonadales bacterium]